MGAHFAQFYGSDDPRLIENVAAFIDEALRQDGGAIVVATPEHREALLAALPNGATTAIASDRLVLLDAAETLERLMVRGFPDALRFDAVAGRLVRDLSVRCEGRPIHAFGEMVSLLWETGQYPSAVRLEQLWSGLQRSLPFSLFCAYAIDVLGERFHPDTLDALLCAHSYLVSTQAPALERAIVQAIDDAIGMPAVELQRRVREPERRWGQVPPVESLILWLRKYHGNAAGGVLARALTDSGQPA